LVKKAGSLYFSFVLTVLLLRKPFTFADELRKIKKEIGNYQLSILVE